MKLRVLSGIVALSMMSVFSVTAIAADDPIKARQELMEGIGKAAKTIGGMAQGKIDFDAAKAKEALDLIATNAADFPNHFPAGSYEGKTEALPLIADNLDDFTAKSKKLAEDATAASAATASGKDAFAALAGPMFGNCKGCHEKYRKPS